MSFNKIIDDLYVFYGNLSANTYLFNLKKPILIDPGIHNEEDFMQALKDLGIRKDDIKTILLTHSHFDHFINCKLFPSADIFCSEVAARDLREKDSLATVSFWIQNSYYPSKLNILKPDQELDFDNFRLKVIEAKGHTFGDIVFYDKKKKLLFSGDTLFWNASGRTDLPNSSYNEMIKSLQKLEKLDFKYLLPGHAKVYVGSEKHQKENIKRQIEFLQRSFI